MIAATLGATTLGVSLLADLPVARAQSSSRGAIQGQVTDAKTGEKLAGVTVTVSSPALGAGGVQSAITDENGFYKITELPPGEYNVTFYYLQITLQRSGITIGIGKTAPVFQKLDQGKAAGEIVNVVATAPTIDPTSTTQGITIDKNYIKNIPVPGRTFEAALGAAAGSQGDGLGISFSGSSSLENQYYVDGVNTTGLTFGTVGSPVINDFIEEIEVITGGYNAEFGRATGGVVNVVTKSGSNEFKGSVFGYFQPGALTAPVERTPINAASIDAVSDNVYIADFGFEVGGPIIKDKLWFFVGFVPQFRKTDITRTTKRQTDCRKLQSDGTLSTPADRPCSLDDSRLVSRGGFADGVPDVDPATGFFITENLDDEIRSASLTAYNMLGKINYALNPENQGQISVQALPGRSESPGIFGPATSGSIIKSLVSDVSAKWTSKLNNNKTEIEAVVGWHRDHVEREAFAPQLANDPLQVLRQGSLGVWSQGFPESAATRAGCIDGPPGPNNDPNPAGDKYPFLSNNCPMDTRPYVIGGPGSLINDTEQRQAGRISVTQRVKAGGSHEIKAGIDAENNISDKIRAYSGGAFLQNFVGPGVVVVDRWVQLLGPSATNPPMGRFDNMCRTPNPDGGPAGGTLTFTCDYISGIAGQPGTSIQGNTFNWSAYIRDSWQIQPNLTLNAGIRYEEQRLRYADFLQNTVDPLTGEALGKNAMTMSGMFAPRVGLLYDWTKEGRSKIYTHWGRFYESIPMDINDRSFGGEVNFRQQFRANGGNCGATDMGIGSVDGKNCLMNQNAVGNSEQLIGASGVLIAPGIKPQYMDELILGLEYEILDDLKIGVAYKNRRIGRVIEDVSTDGANTYIIANPGEWDQAEQDKLQARIDATDDVKEKARLQNQMELFKGIRLFDRPRRDYNSLEFTLTRRFSKKLYVQGSYTFSKTEGNYPGLISYDNGQVDPNISSQYDLIELLANRIGPLPQDRPHYIKLDGYYTFDFQKKGNLTVGARLRALSGIPTNALGAHYLYGSNESFLLPRGQLGRTDFEHGLDMHFGYGKKLNKNMSVEVFFDVYNIYNRQGQAGIDDNYAPSVKLTGPTAASGTQQNANPVSGGTYEDLIFLKTIDQDGNETPVPIGVNPNFRNTNARYGPGYGRIGVRLTF
ncbi:MAG: TonB-dependent receptor [Deltaproteobacteria bacterium]|nr:TonB-dependent receptor [Deltaproteobacteria bacterium]